jgi:hypothetical protein
VPVTVDVPNVDGEKVTEQLAEAPVPASVHGLFVNVPVPVKLTVPLGVIAVPTSVSVTVAVQVADWPKRIIAVHETAVVVARLLTVTLAVPVLPL